VAVHGGDGTLHKVVTALGEAFGEEPLPPIALLPGGTMNVVATSLGLRAEPLAFVRALVADARAGHAPEVVTRRCMRVGDQLGFVFGNGLASNFLGEYYAEPGGEAVGVSINPEEGGFEVLVGPAAGDLVGLGAPFEFDLGIHPAKHVIRPGYDQVTIFLWDDEDARHDLRGQFRCDQRDRIEGLLLLDRPDDPNADLADPVLEPRHDPRREGTGEEAAQSRVMRPIVLRQVVDRWPRKCSLSCPAARTEESRAAAARVSAQKRSP